MIVCNNNAVICFDVDKTLIHEDKKYSKHHDLITVPDPNQEHSLIRVKPNYKHIKLMRRAAGRGDTVIVWSNSGYAWAEAVIKSLGLHMYVNFIFTKPGGCVDDMPVESWLRRIYDGEPDE